MQNLSENELTTLHVPNSMVDDVITLIHSKVKSQQEEQLSNFMSAVRNGSFATGLSAGKSSGISSQISSRRKYTKRGTKLKRQKSDDASKISFKGLEIQMTDILKKAVKPLTSIELATKVAPHYGLNPNSSDPYQISQMKRLKSSVSSLTKQQCDIDRYERTKENGEWIYLYSGK